MMLDHPLPIPPTSAAAHNTLSRPRRSPPQGCLRRSARFPGLASLNNTAQRGFTLVELLVVIAIIGILIALLLPAVNAAREAARLAQCKNNVRQIAMACLLHEGNHGFLPSGGWGKEWTADPNRGFGKEQPGSWQFSTLPYLEEDAIYRMALGKSVDGREYRRASRAMHETPIATFHCPSRRAALAYPGAWVRCYNSTAATLPAIAKSDYASNGGDGVISSGDPPYMRVPNSYEQADNPDFPWSKTNNPDTIQYHSGVMYYRSEVKLKQLRDGATKTYLLGEKYLNVRSYNFTDVSFGDNQSLYTGYEWDNTRLTHFDENEPDDLYGPRRDNANDFYWFAFGSAHPGGFNMALCDGSVLLVTYDVDRRLHRTMGNRRDGQSASPGQL